MKKRVEKSSCSVCGKTIGMTVFWRKYCKGSRCRQIAWALRHAKRVMLKAVVILLLLAGPVFAFDVPKEVAVKVLISEGANQGFDGMQAIGEVLRRVGPSKFCGLKKRGLDAFISAQGPKIRVQAENAWKASESSNLTHGSTHYENVRAFGLPKWANGMKRVATIKDHVFFKEV